MLYAHGIPAGRGWHAASLAWARSGNGDTPAGCGATKTGWQDSAFSACVSAGNIRIPSPEISGKSTATLANSITDDSTLALYAKYYHMLPWYLLGRSNKKARTWRACIKKQILQNFCSRNAGLAGHQLLKHHRVGWQKTQGKGLLRFNPAQILPLGTTGLTGEF